MTFAEVLTQVRELLQSKGRVSYRALKLQFNLDDDYLEGLKDELIEAEHVAADEGGKVLVWVGTSPVPSSEFRVPSSTRPPVPNTQPPEAERRQLTVMFCDLVGSTALSEQLDPEELREVTRAYQQTCAGVISRFEGYIAQYLGDGLLVYFGYPAAHEDDAARAVRAGLEIVSTVGARHAVPLQVRVGIHTGLVVVGEMGGGSRQEQLALGETPNIAARIQGLAEPDTVVISEATYRLVEGLFECQALGFHTLKGISTPLTLYRVVKAGEARSRFQVVARKGLTPLVGREHEFGLLRERWTRVKEGEGQVVLLSGEPGIGKSRLVEALKEAAEREGARCLELRCSPYTQNSALQPIIEHLQQILQFWPEDSAEEKLRKLIVGATGRSLLQTEAVPLFAALLSLPHPEGYPALSLSPQKQKEKTHEALVAWLCEEAQQHAVIYAWEDLHWADPSTLELLTLLLDRVPTARLLTVLTFRPEFTPPWGARSYLSQLMLSRLGRTHVETMVEKVMRGEPLPSEVVQQIVAKTDGVPLFVEELTKTVLESVGATGRSPLQNIPATLHDSLMARLDRLGPAKEIAQVGATIGREFTYDLLRAVSPLNENTLLRGIDQLVKAELVYQSGAPPQAQYLFKHALIQDTAYQSLLKSRRQQLHHQVAQVLTEQFPQTVETQPELVAHHYTEAGLIKQALPYWQRAGQRAAQRSAHVEAINHLTKGLEVLKTLPDTPERTQQELTLQIALGAPLMATRGWAAPEVERAYTRAHELCQQVGETFQIFPVLWGLWAFYITRGEIQVSRRLAEQSLDLAQNTQNSTFLVGAHYALGVSLLWLGDFLPARTHLEQGIACYTPQQHRSHASLYGWDLGAGCLWYVAWPLCLLGYPDQALARIHEALVLAQEFAHPESLAWTLIGVTYPHQFRREGRLVREQAEAALALAHEQGFALQSTKGAIMQGWALAEQGQTEGGIRQIQQGLVTWQTLSAELGRSYDLALLAEAYGKVGLIEEGLTALAEALDMVNKNGERISEAELYRLKGELVLQSGVRGPESQEENQKAKSKGQKAKIPNTQPLAPSTQEAEACFLKAIDIARKQQAKSLELRAVMSLARLWQRQGKKKEAHQMLTEIYNWFTEGFDTKDLQEAKALLEELS